MYAAYVICYYPSLSTHTCTHTQLEFYRQVMELVRDAEASKFKGGRPFDVLHFSHLDLMMFRNRNVSEDLWSSGYESFLIFPGLCVPISGTVECSLSLSILILMISEYESLQVFGGSPTTNTCFPNPLTS